ncbi:hypothetical protein GMLC_40330 [Geomonas limicola]|uniref:Uncharacterized protein n=1 Tax=Geomonas limicola TaxID=2740186 RepID=A0A6V8NF63_9BACT|nr:hypothetical protein GMLC_40330 [Geomonas limicola]
MIVTNRSGSTGQRTSREAAGRKQRSEPVKALDNERSGYFFSNCKTVMSARLGT